MPPPARMGRHPQEPPPPARGSTRPRGWEARRCRRLRRAPPQGAQMNRRTKTRSSPRPALDGTPPSPRRYRRTRSWPRIRTESMGGIPARDRPTLTSCPLAFLSASIWRIWLGPRRPAGLTTAPADRGSTCTRSARAWPPSRPNARRKGSAARPRGRQGIPRPTNTRRNYWTQPTSSLRSMPPPGPRPRRRINSRRFPRPTSPLQLLDHHFGAPSRLLRLPLLPQLPVIRPEAPPKTRWILIVRRRR
mmetsp:Transcript_12981/g.37044  ORF Transcript_12981/g.37044 Transcript_12981/m.37044 type:complete len:247 (-) Transcript_12981:774-1514(-)